MLASFGGKIIIVLCVGVQILFYDAIVENSCSNGKYT